MTTNSGEANSPITYLDNNATTIMPREVVREMVAWCNCGNPSASYASALRCREMIDSFHREISRYVHAPMSSYDIIFTSGATEANNMICRGVIECARKSGAPFHVVCSSIEHDSIRLLIEGMMCANPQMHVTFVNPSITGHIDVATFAQAIRANTILAICMLANNETGAINDIRAIGAAIRARNARTFFHCDIVQGFAKIPVDILAWNVDGASVSFHKIHGPPGVGAAIIRKDAFCARGCGPLLYGKQNHAMRGGTENVPGIGASRLAVANAMSTMDTAREHELMLKRHLITCLREHIAVSDLTQYMRNERHPEVEVLIIADANTTLTQYLPGTLMISAVKHRGPSACNTLIKDRLESRDNVIVSIGSACNTESGSRSHVLTAMGLPAVVMDGSIRVSMCANTLRVDVERFVAGFLREFKRQYMITIKEERAPKKKTN